MLTQYINKAMAHAKYEQTGEGKYWAEIPCCPGIHAYADTLQVCQKELQDVLEEWILLKLSKGDLLPVVDGINLNVYSKV